MEVAPQSAIRVAPDVRIGILPGRGGDLPPYVGGYIAFIIFWVLLTSAAAQLPNARLLTIFPAGARVGSTCEVAVSGMDLDEAYALVFSHSNIVSQVKSNETTGLAEPNKFVITVASNVPPSTYEVRLAGRFGISNPRKFSVGTLAELQKSADMELPLPSTVNGRVDAQSVDSFKLNAKKGQRVLAVCDATSIDSRLEPSLFLIDSQGHELERSRRGGLLDFEAPADGQYTIKLHDFLFNGGAEYFYRLSVGNLPYIDFVLPVVGTPGSTNKHTLFGRNLPEGARTDFTSSDGKKLEKLEVEIAAPRDISTVSVGPSAAALNAFEFRLTTPDAASNPRLIPLASAPRLLNTNKLTLPCEVSGQFFPAGDIDTYSFDAKKGEVFWIEVVSQRLGLPTDPFVVIQRVARTKEGKEQITDVQEISDTDVNIGGPEFKTSSLDPVGKFEAKEDGAYRLQIRDLFNRANSNPAHVYSLSIRKETPDFTILAVAQPPQSTKKDVKDAIIWPAMLRRGETIPIKVFSVRQHGFSGDIALSASGLPPGISTPGGQIPSGQNSGTLLLTAAESISNSFDQLRIIGRSKDRTNEARAATLTWNVDDMNKEPVRSRLTTDFMLGICAAEPAPIMIETAEAKAYEAPVGGKLQIPLKVTRKGDFNEAFKIKAYGLPALESLKEIEVPNKTNVLTVELDLTQQKLPAGDHYFYFAGQTKGKYSNNPARSKELEELAKDAPEVRKNALTALAKEAAERAKAKEVNLTVYSAPIFLKVTAPRTASASK